MKRSLGIVAIATISGMIAAGAVQSLFSAYAVQNELVPPTSGIYTGVQYSQKIGDAFKSVASGNKGNSAPANVEGATIDGLEWIDDSTTPWSWKRYINGGWAVLGGFDPTTSAFIGSIGGGGFASIASGSTVDLGSVPQANVTVTGTTTVAGFGSSAPEGAVKILRFEGALVLTNSSALRVPGGFSLTTAAGDRAIVTHLGSGNWEVTQFIRDSGIPIDVAAVGRPDYSFQGAVPALYLPGDGRAISRASYPAYAAKMVKVQNGTRANGNAVITVASDVLDIGVGMPVEGTGIGSGCTVADFSSVAKTITLNSSSCVTSSGTAPVTVFLTGYGTGGDNTTIGVPDCRGRVIAGLDGGIGRLTATWAGKYASAMNVDLGNEKNNLSSQSQLPSGVNLSSSGLSASSSTSNNSSVHRGHTATGQYQSQIGGTSVYTSTDIAVNNIDVTTTISGTIPLGGSGASFRTVQPTLTARCVIRVIP